MTQLTQQRTLPTIQDLYADLAMIKQLDELSTLLNSQPQPEWVKIHPFIKGYKYLPIERIEWLLKRIFKKYRIEILREGTSFNGVYVVVRVHYLHPITGEMDYHDGIGASQLQTKQGSSASDLININNGALSMAYPMAKTIAIKDACDHFGRLFGSDLNRKDEITYTIDTKLTSIVDKRIASMLASCNSIAEIELLEQNSPNIPKELINKRKSELK